MQSAGITEDILRSAGPHDERTQQLRRHLDRAADRPDWQHLLHGLERCLAAYAATGTRIKVSLEARKVQRNVGRQLHAHDIAGRTANAGRCNVIFGTDEPFAMQEADGKLDVVTRCAHRD